MWDAIRANQRRSFVLITLMAVILVALGASIGMAIEPQVGGLFGAAVAAGLWLILWLAAVAGGDAILLSSVGAREIGKEDAPQLWNIVEEMTIASGLGRMPRVYIIDDDTPNAFAVGRNPAAAAVAVTSGLLRRLSRDELQGVIGHEIGHIRNLDVKFMTLAGVMVGAIVLISDVFLRAMFYGGGRRRSRARRGGGRPAAIMLSRARRGGGQAAAIMLLVAIALAILGPIFAQLLYFACSRRREYLADACSARYTRYPEGLASALEKIAQRAASRSGADTRANRVLAPMYIVNPLEARSAFSLTSTHPPTELRIRILRRMGGQAGLAAYEAAYRQVTGRKGGCIDARVMEHDEPVPARPPAHEPETRQQAVARAREVGDLLDRMAEYLFIACACGLRLKLPPNFSRPSVRCPRCGREHAVPAAELAALSAAAAGASGRTDPARLPPLRYRRRSGGWESFRCDCGSTVQLSPSFSAPFVRCPKCGRRIGILADGR